MSSHDLIDERFEEIAAELRSTAPVATPELRERVREIASRPPAPARRRFRLRWTLAPISAAALAGAIAIGVADLRDSTQPTPVAAVARTKAPEALGSLHASSPVTPGHRAQLYTAQLTLRVDDLSRSTQRALRTTRRLGGYIRSVDYGSKTASGTAELVLRVPIARVQQAIVRFSGIGTILDQHVSVRDAEPALDRRFVRIAELRRTIPTLSGAERLRAEAELRVLQRAQARDRARASFATVSLHLQTKEASVVVPASPGRIERALERATDVVATELAALVYALVVGAPLLLLGVAAFLGARALRRRSDARLLA